MHIHYEQINAIHSIFSFVQRREETKRQRCVSRFASLLGILLKTIIFFFCSNIIMVVNNCIMPINMHSPSFSPWIVALFVSDDTIEKHKRCRLLQSIKHRNRATNKSRRFQINNRYIYKKKKLFLMCFFVSVLF